MIWGKLRVRLLSRNYYKVIFVEFIMKKELLKEFFKFTKVKLILTPILLLMSFAFLFVAVELHQVYLSLLEPFFNLASYFEHSIRGIMGSIGYLIFLWPVWILQMYVYSCILVWIREKYNNSQRKYLYFLVPLLLIILFFSLMLTIFNQSYYQVSFDEEGNLTECYSCVCYGLLTTFESYPAHYDCKGEGFCQGEMDLTKCEI